MEKKLFCFLSGLFFMALAVSPDAMDNDETKAAPPGPRKPVTMFLAGDVMTGRGIDQILPRPGDPGLHEPFMKSALGYVSLAEEANGPIPRTADYSYVWGYALKELEKVSPDLRIINLETAVTKSGKHWEGKTVHYRMHPENVPVLEAAEIDFCSLANNHVLDWGYPGLEETLEALQRADVKSAGAGPNLGEAGAPAVMDVEGKGRVIVFSYGSTTSGIPSAWAASEDRAGVSLLKGFSRGAVRDIKKKVAKVKKDGDIVVFSVHWGGNWGYDIPSRQREFAHALIDAAGVDLVHGHSSHHAKGIEVYGGKLILYGAGDFLNDYEGIGGREEFRGDLGLLYFARVDPASGSLVGLEMTPTQIRNFRVRRASREDAEWLRDTLNREGERLGTRVELNGDNTLALGWQ